MTKRILIAHLTFMASLIIFAIGWPDKFLSLINHPEVYLHAKLIHVLTVTLFYSNVIIGTIWETKALRSKNLVLIRYTYENVTSLDAIFTSPLIILAVLSGITLATILGGVWAIGWVSIAFCLFLASGLLWLVADIPTQHKIQKIFATLSTSETEIPAPLTRLLKIRLFINLLSILPLSVIFYLMVHKPDLPKIPNFLVW